MISNKFSEWPLGVAELVVHQTNGLYYKNILTIVSDDRKWSLYYSTGIIYDRHLMCFTLAL
jgi:hypothetical protein